jgi:hypothetical protein
MTRRNRKWIFIGIAVAVIATVWAMGEHDYARLVAHKRPTFARQEAYLSDGGSTEYRGIGYTVTAMHKIQGMTSTGKLYRVGQTLDYWIPFVGRDATTFYVRTNR